MEKKVKLTIDGRVVEAPAGTNLINAAELAGVHIPNLCYLKGMKGIGACRLCMVEVEGLKAPMVGCTTRVKEGMVVNTKTAKIEEMRKFVIDLILSMHPLDCMTCTKAGVCNLQQYAYDFEIKESSFTRKKFGFSIDEANPFIKRDPDYCVLCGRCVRVCKNQGTNVLEFMGRGVGSAASGVGLHLLRELCRRLPGERAPGGRPLEEGPGVGVREDRFGLPALRERLRHHRLHERRRGREDRHLREGRSG